MPSVETLKTKIFESGAVLQLHKISYVQFKDGSKAEVYEVSCYNKGKKSKRFGVERFYMPDRAQQIFEQRLVSDDPTKVTGNPNAINEDRIAKMVSSL